MTTFDSARIRKKIVNELLDNSFALKVNVLRDIPLLQLNILFNSKVAFH